MDMRRGGGYETNANECEKADGQTNDEQNLQYVIRVPLSMAKPTHVEELGPLRTSALMF